MSRLKAAARQMNLEDSFESSQRLLDVSEEVATEYGFPSPTKALQERGMSPQKPVLSTVEPETTSTHHRHNEPPESHSTQDSSPMVRKLSFLEDRQSHIKRSDGPDVAAEASSDVPAFMIVTEKKKVNESRAEFEAKAQPGDFKKSLPTRKASASQPVFRVKEKLPVGMDFRLSAEQKRRGYLDTLGRSREFTQSEASAKMKDAEETLPTTKLSKVASLINKVNSTQRSVDSSTSGAQGLFKSSAQEMLCRSMMDISVHKSMSSNSVSSKATAALRVSVDRLSQPKATSSSSTQSTYALIDDQINCTFRPKTAKSKKAREEEESKVNSFLERQDAKERSRRQELDVSICKTAYDARVDKKMCPSCGSKQSYDEMKEKRKKCPNCKVEYVYRVDWNKVSKGFYRRIKAFAQTQERHKQEVLMSIMADWKITKKVYDAVTNKMVTVEIDPFQSKWTKELESEFFERLNEFTESKKENIKKIESDVYSETCTFKPAVNRLKAEVEDDEGYDAFRAFMERYEADWERRLAERQRRMKQMDE